MLNEISIFIKPNPDNMDWIASQRHHSNFKIAHRDFNSINRGRNKEGGEVRTEKAGVGGRVDERRKYPGARERQ